MFDFFNEFFQSEFAKNNVGVVVFAIAILIFIAGAASMWAYLNFIHFKIQINEKKKTDEENKLLTDNNAILQNRVNELVKENQDLKEQLHRQNFSEDMKDYNKNKDNIDDAVLELITQ